MTGVETSRRFYPTPRACNRQALAYRAEDGLPTINSGIVISGHSKADVSPAVHLARVQCLPGSLGLAARERVRLRGHPGDNIYTPRPMLPEMPARHQQEQAAGCAENAAVSRLCRGPIAVRRSGVA